MSSAVRQFPTVAQTRPMMIVALLMLVLAQSASVVHAENHLFHEGDDQCVAFHHVEKQAALLGDSGPNVPPPSFARVASLIFERANGTESTAFRARAPPLFYR